MDTKITLGIIIGNRGFFPAHLCDSGRKEILDTLEKLGIDTIILRQRPPLVGIARARPRPGVQ
jgi:L-fucose isomerase-like protein